VLHWLEQIWREQLEDFIERAKVFSYVDAAGEERIVRRKYTKPELLAKAADRDCPDTGTSRRFNREKHEALEQMRQGDRDAWASAEHRLGDRYRELPERDG
jgi:hypothetical protein